MAKPPLYESTLAACIRLMSKKTPTAGVLLYAIYIKTNSKKVGMTDENGEERWAVWSREEWMHMTGLSAQQFRDSLDAVKASKLVEHKKVKNGPGNWPLWIRITEEAEKLITEKKVFGASNGSTDLSTMGLQTHPFENPMGLQTPSIYIKGRERDKIKDNVKSAKPSVTVTPGGNLESRFRENIKQGKVVKMQNYKDGKSKGQKVLDSKKAKSESFDALFERPEPRSKFSGTKEFQFFWKEHVLHNHPESYEEDWSVKKLNVGKLLVQKFRNGNIDPAKAIPHIISHWNDYGQYLSQNTKIKAFPQYPDIFLVYTHLKHFGDYFRSHDTVQVSATDRTGTGITRRKLKHARENND